MQLKNHSSWLFELKAVIQNVELKFENNFGNKILTESKTSVGKHADKNSSLCYNKANDYCDYFL